MAAVPLIPFLPPPYPDEILGSWLHRVRLHNHSSVLRQLSGLDSLCKLERSEWRDIAEPRPALERLLDALGTGYERAMTELTTYPYWLRFHSDRPYEGAADPRGLPGFAFRDRRQAISRLSYLAPRIVRMCPQCLAEDFERWGEPYLHRSHLLPFVEACHLHRTTLISACPDCHRVFRMESTFVGALITCECGADLRAAAAGSPGEVWLQLAGYSADVLSSTSPIHGSDAYFRFLDKMLAAHAVKRRPSLIQLLALTYGAETASVMLSRRHPDAGRDRDSPMGWIGRRELRAPQICALLASIHSSFAESESKFAEFHAAMKSDDGHRTAARAYGSQVPCTVAEARSFAVEVSASGHCDPGWTRTFLYRRYKMLFWYLVLFDREWFDAHYPPGGNGAPSKLPGIEDDRAMILRAIARARKPRVKIWANLAQQACHRATLRDNDWLDERKRETEKAAEEEKLRRREEYLATCAEEIKRAVERGRATRGTSSLTAKELAPFSLLTVSQLRHYFARNPKRRLQLLGLPARISQFDRS